MFEAGGRGQEKTVVHFAVAIAWTQGQVAFAGDRKRLQDEFSAGCEIRTEVAEKIEGRAAVIQYAEAEHGVEVAVGEGEIIESEGKQVRAWCLQVFASSSAT